MRSNSSSSVISGSGTLFTITECPETELPTFLVFIFCVSKIFEMALATCGASIIAPPATVSCASGSIPKLTSSYPAFVDFSSTAFIELEPISSPTSCLPFRPPSENISRPLSRVPCNSELPAPRVRLAHLPLHPAVQNRFTKFPAVAQLECRYFAFGDVTVQRIRRDPQILRRLPYVHHFSRFIHEESHPVIRTNTRSCNHFLEHSASRYKIAECAS